MEDPALLRRFHAWLQPVPSPQDAARLAFFQDALIVLDTNVLLSLYEYTAESREEVLTALGQVSERLWMPYQVGLEFVRGRRSVLESRRRVLTDASKSVNAKLTAARKAITEAKDTVRAQLQKYARVPAEIDALEELVSEGAVTEHLAVYRDAFKTHLEMLRNGHDLSPANVETADPILPRVADLYGDRVGLQPDDQLLQQRLDEAMAFRFPNQIPPGFKDFDKGTPLKAAGDFLIWEEVIEQAALLPEESRRVLFVSNDVKEDWYDTSNGKQRPWPALLDEIKRRAGAELRLETPPAFYAGVGEYLNADLADDTYEEIRRVSETFTPPTMDDGTVVTARTALKTALPGGLPITAYRSAGLTSSALRSTMESLALEDRLAQWWLIGVTAQLQRREVTEGEPRVDIAAALRGSGAPAPDWKPGTVLPSGEWIHRESSWIAPWFLDLLGSAPPADRGVLSALASEQAAENHRRTG
ncbi:PIN-like domain-containing protein [Streptomyces diastatochromogenes]|uniref:PIN-like domain-containing protein n=1 Tax=Streptomyces diastatochromogenes TaxID=42236 RepID=UPI0036CE8F36